jgi:hypothetical protein
VVRSSISSVINAAIPFFSPIIPRVPSLVISQFVDVYSELGKGSHDCSLSSSGVTSFIIGSAVISSVTQDFEFTPLMKIANCAMSAIALLSSSPIGLQTRVQDYSALFHSLRNHIFLEHCK